MGRRTLTLAVALLVLAAPARAQTPATSDYPGLETGKMWTFDVPPLEYWAKRYGFRPGQEWLDHARLSAARLPGCSASFVSGDGLVMTNHHCARACIASSTRTGEDLLENGFYARARGEERS
ncbi:MAG: S46 family peptidase, partial [Candidatus Rokuibacteriota bacterium]